MQAKTLYAIDDAEKDKIIEGLNGNNYEVGRFKGLGEMPAEDLRSTTMNKDNRTLIRVSVDNQEKPTTCSIA